MAHQSFGKQNVTLLYGDKSENLSFYSVITYDSLRRTARGLFDIQGDEDHIFLCTDRGEDLSPDKNISIDVVRAVYRESLPARIIENMFRGSARLQEVRFLFCFLISLHSNFIFKMVLL
jgi:hypothetical protein